MRTDGEPNRLRFPGEAEIRECGLRLDTVYDLLADATRRRVLEDLYRRDESTVEDLADRIGDASDGPEDAVRATIALTHTHLPRLRDAGVIEYDERTGAVVLSATGRDLLEGFDSSRSDAAE